MSANFDVKPVFRQLYKQTYTPLKSWVSSALLPASMPHLNKGMQASAIEMRAAGKCTLNGKEYEFHDIRVYVDLDATPLSEEAGHE